MGNVCPQSLPLAALLLASLLASTAAAKPLELPVPAAPAFALADRVPKDPAVEVGRFANGLTYYLRHNAKPEKRAELWLVVNAGSVLEDDDQQGLAHFVEHMAFSGTAHFPKQELIRYLESIGMRSGADINASTSFEETVYTLKRVPTDKAQSLETAVQILEDWAHAVTFDPVEVERERGVVIEEWRRGRGAATRLRDKQLPVLLHGSRYAIRLPIGTKESLDHATVDEIKRFYRDWYRPELMAVVAVGDFDKAQLLTLLDKHLSGLRGPESPRPRPVFPVPDHKETLFALATDPETTGTAVSVAVKRDRAPRGTVGDFRLELVRSLELGLLNERLREVAQAPDAPFLRANVRIARATRVNELLSGSAEVKPEGVERGLSALLTEVERVHRHGFQAAELDRAKRNLLDIFQESYDERDKEDSATYASDYRAAFLNGEPIPDAATELALARQLVPGITLAEVDREVVPFGDETNRVVSLSAPQGKGTPPGEPALRAVFASVGKQGKGEIGPWTDRTQAGPLVAKAPAPGTIAQETKIAELGVTEWRLSNGARVVLKPTSFRNEEIELTAIAPGGLSLVADKDLASAELAPALLREGGLGTFDSVTLGKAMTGKRASASAFLADIDEGVLGVSSPRDFASLLELVYLSFTAPRRDEASFKAALARRRTALVNRLSRPETVFAEKVDETLSQGSPRRLPLTPERLDHVDLDTALRIYRERFADASGFTFFLVGNFTPDAVRQPILTYLGGLPSRGAKESFRDVGVRPPSGVVKVAVDKGLEPKSQVQIVFTGPARFSLDANHDLQALAAVMRIRLREVLREDLGAIYGVSVGGSVSQRPWQSYRLAISFGCAPENVDKLVAAVFAEVAALRDKGVADGYVQKVKEGERRQREVDLETNSFWMTSLRTYYTEGLDPREILRYGDRLERLTPERLLAAARLYMPADRYVLAVLKPEATTAAAPAKAGGR